MHLVLVPGRDAPGARLRLTHIHQITASWAACRADLLGLHELESGWRRGRWLHQGQGQGLEPGRHSLGASWSPHMAGSKQAGALKHFGQIHRAQWNMGP